MNDYRHCTCNTSLNMPTKFSAVENIYGVTELNRRKNNVNVTFDNFTVMSQLQ